MKSSSVVSLLRNVTVSWEKCSTAIRIGWFTLVSPQYKSDARLGEAAGNADRRAVGTPARRARQQAVIQELDRVHAAANRRHLDDMMAHRSQLGTNAFRHGPLDFERIALGPDPGRLDRLLQAHAVVDQI